MKTKNSSKKVVVSVLALAMGAGLAGSISGSVAWYQYSTRTTAQLQGVSAGTTRNLQVRIGSDANLSNAALGWKQDLTKEDIKAYLDTLVTDSTKPATTKLNPVTVQTEGLLKNAPIAQRDLDENELDDVHDYVPAFSSHPVYQYNELPAVNTKLVDAGADSTFNYIQIPLQFKVEDNGAKLERDIYIVDAIFGDTNTTDAVDVTPAIRAHFHSNTMDALLADTAESTTVSGLLDLNKNDKEDRFAFTGDDTSGYYVNYGKDETNDAQKYTSENIDTIVNDAQLSYKVAEGDGKLLADDSDPYDFDGGIALGTTTTTDSFLTVTLTIWLEGWAELGTSGNIWSYNYSGLTFDLGLRFACVAER